MKTMRKIKAIATMCLPSGVTMSGDRLFRALLCALAVCLCTLPMKVAAQDSTLWSATLTVARTLNTLGCSGGNFFGNPCSNSDNLSDNDFELDGTSYIVNAISFSGGRELTIQIIPTLPADLTSDNLVVEAGEQRFGVTRDDTVVSGRTTLRQASAGLSWSEGDSVAMKLIRGTPPAADATAPTVTSIVRRDPVDASTNANALTWRVTFNESVTGVSAEDFEVDGTTATLAVLPVAPGVASAGAAWDVTARGGNLATLDGAVALRFVLGQDIEDLAGNALTATTPTGTNDTYTVANLPQVASITRFDPETSPTRADKLIWRVTFDEPVRNVSAGDFKVDGTSADLDVRELVLGDLPAGSAWLVGAEGGNLPELNARVTLEFDEGQDIEDLAGNVLEDTTPACDIEDLAGNVLENTTPTCDNDNSYAMDNAQPSVRIEDVPARRSTVDSFLATIRFSEPMAGFTEADIAVEGATLSAFTSDETPTPGADDAADGAPQIRVWTITVTPLNEGRVTLNIAEGAATDAAGNPNVAAPQVVSIGPDARAPRVASIVRRDPTDATTDADALTWRVTFSELVVGVDATDFAVDGTDATLAVAAVSGATGAWDVTASGGDLAGLNATVTLRFAAGQNIADAARNRLANTAPTGTNENSYAVANAAAPQALWSATLTVQDIGGLGITLGCSNAVPLSRCNNENFLTDDAFRLDGASYKVTTIWINNSGFTFQVEPAFPAGTAVEALFLTVDGTATPVSLSDNRTLLRNENPGFVWTEGQMVTLSLMQGAATPPEPDADPPMVTISGPLDAVMEGAALAFTVTLDAAAPTEGLTVYLDVSETGDVVALADEGLRTVTVPWRQTQATLTVETATDAVDDDGVVTVRIERDGTYRVGDPSEAAVTVTDDDERGFTITPDNLTVAEGGATEYTVVLTSEPARPSVTLAPRITSITPPSVAHDVTVFLRTLTFTRENWNEPQTVTVRAARDADAENDLVEIRYVADGGDYDGLTTEVVSVTVTEVAVPQVTIAALATPVTEGFPARFTLTRTDGFLDEALTVDVALTATGDAVAAGDEGINEGMRQVTFAARSATADLRVGTVADDVDEPDSVLTAMVVADTTDPATYTAGSASSATVTVVDDDATPRVTLTFVDTDPPELAEISEGQTDGNSVALRAQLNNPSSEDTQVTITVPADAADALAVTPDPPVLTIPAGATESDNTVTLTAIDDDVYNPTRLLDIDGTVTNAHGVGAVITALLQLNDDDLPFSTVTVVAQEEEVVEGQVERAFWTLRRTGDIAVGIEVHYVIKFAHADFFAPPHPRVRTSRTILPGEAENADIRVRVRDTDYGGDSGELVVTILPDPLDPATYGIGSPSSASVRVLDDDAPPVVTIAADAGAVTEGADVVFTLTRAAERDAWIDLTEELTVDVVPTGSTDDVLLFALAPSTATFEAGSATAAYRITLPDDDFAEADAEITVTVMPPPAADPNDPNPPLPAYQVGAPASAEVTVRDNDMRGVTATPMALIISEGTNGFYDVVLTSQPIGTVTITPSSNNDDVTFSPDVLTFDSITWDEPQTMTVTAMSDADTDDETVTVSHVVAGADYDGDAGPAVNVTVSEDALLVATLSGPSDATEGDGLIFTVTLDAAAPAGGVGVDVAVSETGDVIAASNEGARTVTVAADQTQTTFTVPTVNDDDDEAASDVTAAILSDAAPAAYQVGAQSKHTATVADNDLPIVTFDTFDRAVTEGQSIDFQLERHGDLSVPLTVDLSVTEMGSFTSGALPSRAVFAPGRATTILSIETDDDAVDEDDGSVALQVLAASNSGIRLEGSGGIATQLTAEVTVRDNDTRGVAVTGAPVTVTEGGNSATYKVALTSEPTAEVTITPMAFSGDTDAVTLSPPALIFTPEDWDTPKEVKVTVVADADPDDETMTITHTVAGGDYGSVTVVDVTVTVADPPTVVSIERLNPATSPTNADRLTWRVTFSEPVRKVNSTDFVLAEGTRAMIDSLVAPVVPLGFLTGSAAWDVTASGGDLAYEDATVTLGFASPGSLKIEDMDGNQLTKLLSSTTPTGKNDNFYVVDNTLPTVAFDNVPAISAAPFTARITFSEPVTGFALSDIRAEGATLFDFTETTPGMVWTVEVFPGADGPVTLDIRAGAVRDTAGNANVAAPQATSTFTAPDTAATVILSGPSMAVTEGAELSFTLMARDAVTAAAGLTVDVSVSETGDVVATSNEGVRTVTIAMGETEATFTVPTVNDDDDEASSVVTVQIVADATDPAAYQVGSPALYMATVRDNDLPIVKPQVIPVDSSTITEGERAGFNFRRIGDLSVRLEVPVTVTQRGDFISGQAPSSLIFKRGDAEASVRVLTGDDDIDEDQGVIVLNMSETALYRLQDSSGLNIPSFSASVDVRDNDRRDVTVIGSPVAVNEGATATYTVVLDSQPTANVKVTPVSADTDAVTVSPSELIFAPAEWDQPQTVTVMAVPDADTSDETVTVSHAVEGGGYEPVTVTDVTVNVTDVTAVMGDSIWSGTLTVKQLSNAFLGCSNEEPTAANQCEAALDDDDFVLDGVTYDLARILLGADFELSVTPALPASVGLALTVDGQQVALSSRSDNAEGTATFFNNLEPGLAWMVDQQVALKLFRADPPADKTAPTVVSITRDNPPASPTNEGILIWRVEFSEPVENVDATDFMVSGTTATVSLQDIGDRVVFVRAADGDLADLDGTVTLSFVGTQDIADEAGNPLTVTTPTGANDNSYTVDNIAPTVVWTLPASLEVGKPIVDVQPTTNDDDIVSYSAQGLPDGLTLGGSTGLLFGTPAMVGPAATVTVTVTDQAGNTAQFTLEFPAVIADTVAPTVVSISRSIPTDALVGADVLTLTWEVRFSELVENVDAADFVLNGAPDTALGDRNQIIPRRKLFRASFYSAKHARSERRFDAGLRLRSGHCRPEAGNRLTNVVPTGANDNTYTVDIVAPMVQSIVRQAPATSPTNADSLTWRVTFSEAVENVDTADFMVDRDDRRRQLLRR